jgi:hypothetical protein
MIVMTNELPVRPELAEGLAAAQAEWGERGEVMLDAGVDYVAGRPVRVHVRKRERRYVLDDDGAAVAGAGRPRGWLAAAERAVAEEGANINRRGVVFVPAVEGRNLVALAGVVAEASLAVYETLLELDDAG